MNVVSLEGPEAVELAAKNAAMVFKDSFVGLLLEKYKAEDGEALDEQKSNELNTTRIEAKAAFIEAASKALG